MPPPADPAHAPIKLDKNISIIINAGHALYSATVKPDVVTKDNTWKIKSKLLIDDNLPPAEKRNTKTRRPIIIAKNVFASELVK
tara:strand:+ start:145 stop:396 length:252 start_codon:yes stop_codon:yes gene_type:complete